MRKYLLIGSALILLVVGILALVMLDRKHSDDNSSSRLPVEIDSTSNRKISAVPKLPMFTEPDLFTVEVANSIPPIPTVPRLDAWMSLVRPLEKISPDVLVRFSINDELQEGAVITAVAHFQKKDRALTLRSSKERMRIPINVLGDAPAGVPVFVDVTAVFKGETYTTETVFIPQARTLVQ